MAMSEARKRSLQKTAQKLHDTKKQLRVWMEPEEYAAIEAAAKREGKSIAQYVKVRCIPQDQQEQ